MEFSDILNQFTQLDRLKVWLGHFREVAKAGDDRLQVRNLRKQSGGAFTEGLIKLLLTLLAGAKQIFYRQLQREEGIF